MANGKLSIIKLKAEALTSNDGLAAKRKTILKK